MKNARDLFGPSKYIIATILALLFVFVFSGKANANILPESGPAYGSHFLEIAKAGGGSSLEAPNAFFKWYSDDQDFKIRIFDGCVGSGYDLPQTGCSAHEGGQRPRAIFRMFALDVNENRVSDFVFQDWYSDNMTENGWRELVWNFPTALKSLKTGKYTIEMHVFFTAPVVTPQINAFRLEGVESEGDRVGYFAAYSSARSTPFSQQWRGPTRSDGSTVSTDESQFQFKFAPDCSLASRSYVNLEWTDADANGGFNPGINFRLYDETAGANVTFENVARSTRINRTTNPTIGGNGEYRQMGFYIEPNHKYAWIWDNVTRSNGVQLWLPFDSNNYSVSCPPPIPLPPPLVASCGGLTVSPSLPEVNENFSVSVSFRLDGGVVAIPHAYDISLEVGGIFGPSPIGSGTVSPGNSASATKAGLSSGSAGEFSGQWVVSGPDFSTINCPFGGAASIPPIEVVTKPYFQVINGDVSTGIGTDCPGWTQATTGNGVLTSWNNGLNPTNKGSGVNLAVYALDAINGFASAQSTSGSSPPNDLSFDNQSSPIGKFTGDISCPTNYFSNATTPSPGNLTISSLTIIPLGERRVIYVNGNVQINANIEFTSGATTVDELPNYYLITKGNIYIDASVTRLDGVYVAQDYDKIGKGKIYTCSAGINPPNTSHLISSTPSGCQRTLTVNGAFIANEIKLYRSNGTMSSGPTAEIFNYIPNVWLAKPNGLGTSTFGSSYDAITSLPPIL